MHQLPPVGSGVEECGEHPESIADTVRPKRPDVEKPITRTRKRGQAFTICFSLLALSSSRQRVPRERRSEGNTSLT